LNGIVARELIDALKASLEQTPLACVLPYDFEANNIKSAADVNATLAQYLELKVNELTPYFNSCQMVQPQQNVGEIIWQDYQTLKKLGNNTWNNRSDTKSTHVHIQALIGKFWAKN